MNATTKRLALAAASLAVVLVTASPAAVGRAFDDDASLSQPSVLPGDSAVPFWPHETGALMGTSETYIDMHNDGSYYDPSIGRRVVVAQTKR